MNKNKTSHQYGSPSTSTSSPKWVRSPKGLIAGVCQGLADSFGFEAWLVRTVLILSVLGLGTGLWVYLILAFTLPRRDKYTEAQERILLGVCGKITRRTGTEIGIVRSLCVGFAFLSLGATVLGYFVLYFLMPDTQHRPLPVKTQYPSDE